MPGTCTLFLWPVWVKSSKNFEQLLWYYGKCKKKKKEEWSQGQKEGQGQKVLQISIDLII